VACASVPQCTLSHSLGLRRPGLPERRTIPVMLRRFRHLIHHLRLPSGGGWDVGMTSPKRARPRSWVDTFAPWWSHGQL
jgi:hypothetical protein